MTSNGNTLEAYYLRFESKVVRSTGWDPFPVGSPRDAYVYFDFCPVYRSWPFSLFAIVSTSASPTSKFMQPLIQLIFRNTETDSHLYFLGTSFWFRWRYSTGQRCRKNCSRKKDQSENRRDKQSGIICLVHSVNATVDLKLPRSWRVVLVALIKLARDISIMTIGGAATLQNPSQFSDITPSWDLPGEVSVDQVLDKLPAAKRSIWLCIISI